MSLKPIALNSLTLKFAHKTCFENFSARIFPGERIGIIGQNGSGKSHLLRFICEQIPINEVGYVPQIIERSLLSGAERFNKALSQALANNPAVLLLDEPTNHLDAHNRASLMRMIRSFDGAVIVVSHDIELLNRCVDKIWHISGGGIAAFVSYDEFIIQTNKKKEKLEATLHALKEEKRKSHEKLMRDQERAHKKRAYGEKKYDGDKLALRSAQGRGELTTNRNRKRISDERDVVLEKLHDVRLPEVMKPRFCLPADLGKPIGPVVSVRGGSCGYDKPILTNINFQLSRGERALICGKNGSGKSTFLRAVMGDIAVFREGIWMTPSLEQIGYLDQHYANLNPERSAFDIIACASPNMQRDEIRDHLNAFLLRKNEEVFLKSQYLSGGEKARLSLAQIAAQTPSLLILDELTNNLDLETKEHVTQVLQEYPGALLVVTHDEDFAERIGIRDCGVVSHQ